MKINIGDVRLYVDVDGKALVPDGPEMVERPTVLLLHGGPGLDHSTSSTERPTASPTSPRSSTTTTAVTAAAIPAPQRTGDSMSGPTTSSASATPSASKNPS